jgi:hypothetical protein
MNHPGRVESWRGSPLGSALSVSRVSRVVKILMRLPDGNISAAHLSVLYNRLIP